MRYIQHRSLAIGIALGMILVSAYAGPSKLHPRHAASRQQRLNYYTLGEPTFSEEHLTLIARSLNLAPTRTNDNVTAMQLEEDGAARGYVSRGEHPELILVPNLARLKAGVPDRRTAVRDAEEFAKKMRLMPNDVGQLEVADVNVWSRQSGEKGKPGKTEDMVRRVVMARKLDNLFVYGPSSSVSIDLTSEGVQGVNDSLRKAGRSDRKVELKSPAEAKRELDMHLKMQPKNKARVTVNNIGVVYYEQGKQFIQPAYAFAVEFNGPDGLKAANMFFIAAGKNTPEPIDMPMPSGKEPGAPREQKGTIGQTFGDEDLFASLSPAPAQANPVKIGMYIVREDNGCWLTDAQQFWANLQHGAGTPAKQLRDYYWDYAWLWENFGGISDQSRYYVGQCHLGLLEGHGAPWEITCYKDYGDIIHINQVSGFGASRGFGEITNYLIWHSCDVIPVPGDPHGGDFQSGTVWDVWWNVFRGMRGNYGYRTTMAICDGVGGLYGDQISRRIPMTAAWLNVTGSQWSLHLIGWDYGSLVIVSGHEGDTLYNNTAVPPPGSLTMWWNHA